MTNDRKPAPLTARALQRVILLALAYVALIFLLPPSQATMRAYHLSALGYRVTLFAIMLPSLLAWVAAFIGYAKLRQYVASIRETAEGAAFDKLADGCAWLVWSLPVPALVSLLLGGLANHWPGLYTTNIIVTDYVSLLLPLVAFTLIGEGSRGLVNQAKLRLSLVSVRTLMLLFLIGGVLYCYLTFQRFDSASLAATNNPYFLPVWLIVLTLMIPYLYAWFIGILAAYEISLFGKHTNGILYRQALTLLVSGLVVIIASSIAQQYVGSLQTHAAHLLLGSRLLLITIFRVIAGGGFVLMAFGAARLKKIEEV